MDSLNKKLAKLATNLVGSEPTLFDLKNSANQKTLAGLISKHRIQYVIDDYVESLKELFAVNNPTKIFSPDFAKEFDGYLKKLKDFGDLGRAGKWVFYPWLSTIVHVLPEDDFQKVRTARNRNLITEAEQKKFYESVVGIGGLSIGNSVALAIVVQGGAKHIRLADFDRLALSNTNRIRTGVQNLGLMKVEMTARQIYEVNPYAKVELFREGLTPKNISGFFVGPPNLDIVIDELDNIAVKLLIRQEARKNKVAVVMAADNGDNAVVDIERYDLNPKTQFFHGRLGNVTYDELANLDKLGIGRTITKHIGPENITERMQNSLLEIGKTIVSWPQLGGAALLNGSAVAYCVRKILNNQPIEKNRALISLDEKLIPGYNSPAQKNKRQKISNGFKKMFGL